MCAQAYVMGLYPTGLPTLNEVQMKHAHDLLAPPVPLTISNEVINGLKDKPMPFRLPIVPIHTVNTTAERILFSASCPLIDTLLKKYFVSDKYYALIQNKYKTTWQTVMNAYPEITEEYLLKEKNAMNLADYIVCARIDGRKPWLIQDTTVEELVMFIHDCEKGEYSMHELMPVIAISDVTKEILAHMNRTIEDTSQLRYALYSGHGISLVIYLLALNRLNSSISVDLPPVFASNLLFELNAPVGSEKDPAAHWVAVYYNGVLIHNQSYPDFRSNFAAVGQLKVPREEACRINSLRFVKAESGGSRGMVGIIEDYRHGLFIP